MYSKKQSAGIRDTGIRKTRTLAPLQKKPVARLEPDWSKHPPISVTHPEVSKEWHQTKNYPLTPDDFTQGSGVKVWWQCPVDTTHVWQAIINCRTQRGHGCAICAPRRGSALHSLAALYPTIAAQWHPEKNGSLTPADVGYASRKKVCWQCEKVAEHNWYETVSVRTVANRGCPQCLKLRRRASNGLELVPAPLPVLSESHPDLAREWHPTKNGTHSPDRLNLTSTYFAWWQCAKNPLHIWQRQVQTRAKHNSACPLCVLERESFAAQYPEIAKEWHPTLNGELRPEHVTAGSDKSVWWQCRSDPEHVFKTDIYSRAVEKTRCPMCCGKVADTKTCLAALRPDLAREWHPDKNGALTPAQVRPGSGKMIWWRCQNNSKHEWQAPPCMRNAGERQCPYCYGKLLTDDIRLSVQFPEIAAQWHPTMNRLLWSKISGSFKVRENLRLPPEERGKRNRRLRPSDVSVTSKEIVWWQCPLEPTHVWKAAVYRRTQGSGCPYCNHHSVSPQNNLAAKYPAIGKLWHPTRNAPLLPSQVMPGSAKMVWWRCLKNALHVWKSHVYSVVKVRQKGGRACPFCSGQKVGSENNLAVKEPQVAKLWHPTRNRLKASEVTVQSNRKVWWRCSKGHEWKSEIANVTRSVLEGCAACPYCSGRKASPENNLATMYPMLTKLWHPQMNLPLRPCDVRHGTPKRVWWRCLKTSQHVWQASVCAVVQCYQKGKYGCPFCAGKRTTTKTSLTAQFPQVAALWDAERNQPLKPTDVRPYSKKRVWWRCLQNSSHCWEEIIGNEVKNFKDGRIACRVCRATDRRPSCR